jgi:hypothetical protein
VIIATTAEGRVLMARGYEDGSGRQVPCLPAGLLEGAGWAVDGARRERREETACDGGRPVA